MFAKIANASSEGLREPVFSLLRLVKSGEELPLPRPALRAHSGFVPRFVRHIGIDYSGAGAPTASLRALQVFAATPDSAPREVPPPAGRPNWSRRAIAEWLAEILSEARPTLVGIDHGFSFPLAYFQRHGLPPDWANFLDDFHAHWPTDCDAVTVADVREGRHGNGPSRGGESTWLRLTERWTASAKSVFQFDVQGQVATSTHAGLPWLRFLRAHCGEKVHFWPFDGWNVPDGRSVLAEVYPSLWMRRFDREGRDPDRHAAFATAAWLRRADLDGTLSRFLSPAIDARERSLASMEGWILGVL